MDKEAITAAREAEVDEILAEFSNDHRAAIAALLNDIDILARDRAAAVSHGYTRGQMIPMSERRGGADTTIRAA